MRLLFILAALLNLLSCAPVPESKTMPILQEQSQTTISPDEERANDGESASRSRRRQIVNALWESPFGRDFHRYMEKDLSAPEVVQLSTELVDRIFQNGGQSITYISAIQIMTEDLFENGQFRNVQTQRLSLLQSNIMQKQADVGSYPGEGLAYLAIISILGALPFGSPAFREVAKYWLSRESGALARYLHLDRLHIYRNTPFVSITSVFSKEELMKYNVSVPIAAFFKYFGPFSLVYFYWYDWSESAKGHSLEPAIRHEMSEASFQKRLEELRSLK